MSNTLKVTIDEECFINGMDLGGRKTITVSTGINQFTRQVKTIKTDTLGTLVQFDNSSYSDGAEYLDSKVRYLRFTNLSTTQDAQIVFHGADASSNDINAYFSLPANTSMMVFGNADSSSPGSDATGVLKSFLVTTSGSGANNVTLGKLQIIKALAAADIQIETIVATE